MILSHTHTQKVLKKSVHLINLRDVVKVSKLLASKPDLVNCESDGRTPLLAAVHHQKQEVRIFG